MKMRYALLLPAVALILSGGALAQTITVCPSGCDHTSIQAAIDAAPEGAQISVGPGTYDETLAITKGLTLDGAGPAATRIDVTGFPGWGIYTIASNVTIQDLSVTGAAGYYSLKIMGLVSNDPLGSGNGVPATNVALKNLVVAYSERSGVDVNGVHGLLIEDVVVTDSDGGNGVTLTDVRNATLRRIRTINNEWGGVAVYTSGEHYPLGVSNIDFTGLNIAEHRFYVELGNYASPANPAPATRLIVHRNEWPYYAHSNLGAAFDKHRHGPNGRPTPSDCVNVTTMGVFACTPAQAGRSLAEDAPGAVAVEGVAPNPIRRSATVRFALPDVGLARLAVFDLLGREVAVVAEGEFTEGEHTATFDAGALAAGLYLVRLTSPYGATVRRVTVAR
jgi:hypothetical protein